MPVVIFAYVTANVAYMAVLPIDQIADFSSGQPVQGYVPTILYPVEAFYRPATE